MDGGNTEGAFPSAGPGNSRPVIPSMEWVKQNMDKMGIDWASLPKLPMWSGICGYTENWRRTCVTIYLMKVSLLVNRELEPQEKEALAHSISTRLVTESYEPPFLLGLTLWAERRGRARLRFPFWTPKPTMIDPQFFPHKRVAVLRGQFAMSAWRALRTACYASVIHPGLKFLFLATAASSMLQAENQDPRLKAIKEATGFADPRPGIKGSTSGSPAYPPYPTRQDETPATEGTEDARSDQTGSDSPQAPVRTPRSRWGSRPSPAPKAPSPSPPPASVGTSPTSSPWSDEQSELFDDASPVAPSAQQSSSSSSSSPVSSWEEIRRRSHSQAGPGSSAPDSQPSQVPGWAQRQQRTQQPNRGSGNNEQDAYSTADEERAHAKQQAQNEFDAMLEKERRGGNEGRK
jgi:hypothetical protein